MDGQDVGFVLFEIDSFSYTVTASNVPGRYAFSGSLETFGKSRHTVRGSSVVTVSGPTATRSFSPPSVIPGGQLRVTISAKDYGAAGQVTESLPGGFNLVSVSPPGIEQVSGRSVTFTLVGEDQSFTYTLSAPETEDTYSFTGTLTDFEQESFPVRGSKSARVAVVPPTALRAIGNSQLTEGETTDITVISLNYGIAGTLRESLDSGLQFVSTTMPDALVVSGQTLTWTLVGDNQSVTYTVMATEAGEQSVSGLLTAFDRQVAPVAGGSKITVVPKTPPSTPGGVYVPPATPTPEPTVPPTATPVPPTATPVPPTATPVPPTATPVPPTATPVPPTATPVPPTATSVPPTATPVPPTATPVPPTATPVPPTATPVPPTATPVPPTATPVPPTATPVPPTATPVPPTATPVPPTATPVPPTATPVPPTATPVPPTATPVPPPAPTATPVPPAPEEEGGIPAWAIILIILAILAAVGGGLAYVRYYRARQLEA